MFSLVSLIDWLRSKIDVFVGVQKNEMFLQFVFVSNNKRTGCRNAIDLEAIVFTVKVWSSSSFVVVVGRSFRGVVSSVFFACFLFVVTYTRDLVSVTLNQS